MSIPLELRTDLDFIFGQPAIVLWGLFSGNDEVPIPPQGPGYRLEEQPKSYMFPRDGTEHRWKQTRVPMLLDKRGFALGYFIYKTDLATLYYGYIDLSSGIPTPEKYQLTFSRGKPEWLFGDSFYQADYDTEKQPYDESLISNVVVNFNDSFYNDNDSETPRYITMKEQLAKIPGVNLEEIKRTKPELYAKIFREELPEPEPVSQQRGILHRMTGMATNITSRAGNMGTNFVNYFRGTPSTGQEKEEGRGRTLEKGSGSRARSQSRGGKRKTRRKAKHTKGKHTKSKHTKGKKTKGKHTKAKHTKSKHTKSKHTSKKSHRK